jgi:hypothetical protein
VLLTLNLPLLLSDNLMTPSSVNSLSSTAFQLLSFVSQADHPAQGLQMTRITPLIVTLTQIIIQRIIESGSWSHRFH